MDTERLKKVQTPDEWERHAVTVRDIKCIKFALIDRREAIENIFAASYAAGGKRVRVTHEGREPGGEAQDRKSVV